MTAKSEKIDYEENYQILWYLNIIISSFNILILSKYHESGQRFLPSLNANSISITSVIMYAYALKCGMISC